MSTDFEKLQSVMATLRDPQSGCPWDIDQTHQSLIPYLMEEAYEVIDAIETGDGADLGEELGDLLLQIVFHAQIASESARFTLNDIARDLSEKLIRRHPHVFADACYENDAQREAAWEQHKTAERSGKRKAESLLDGVARAQPALMRAHHLQRRAARAGFDWEHAGQVIPKVHEELEEVQQAIRDAEPEQRVREEVGDLLFAVVNLARHLGIHAEEALRQGNEKFTRRFQTMERQLATEGKSLSEYSLEELELLWQQAKRGGTAKPL